MAFLSQLDDRARPKGSRDPLGFENVWAHFGRRVVGNLTTITSSWRIFAVGLLGFHWCNRLCQDVHPRDKQKVLQAHFIRYEQLAAFLRSSAGDNEIMGITRVQRRLADDNKTVDIGIEPSKLILSDQLSYGIWGLYSTALRESGLLRGNYRELTPDGLNIVGLMEDRLNTAWYDRYLRGDRKTVSKEELKSEGVTFIKAITQLDVKQALIHALLRGPRSADGRCYQEDLYRASREIEHKILTDRDVAKFITAISAKTDMEGLRQALADICRIERLLVTANVLFSYCRCKGGRRLDEVAGTIDGAYDFGFLPDGPRLDECPYGIDLGRFRDCLKQRRVLDALRGLLDLNNKVMAGRGGAAWVETGADGKLRVRVDAETATLPSQELLQSDWHYDYFLRSFARIAAMERESER